MSDSSTRPVAAAPVRRGPAFRPFAPRLEPIDPSGSDVDLVDDDPTETMDRPDDDDEERVGPS